MVADAISARATDDESVIVKKQEQKQVAKKPERDKQRRTENIAKTDKASQAKVKSHSLSRLAGVACQLLGACRLERAGRRFPAGEVCFHPR